MIEMVATEGGRDWQKKADVGNKPRHAVLQHATRGAHVKGVAMGDFVDGQEEGAGNGGADTIGDEPV